MFHECDYMLNVGAELRKVGVKLVLFDLGNALGCRNQYKSSPGPRATSRALESVTDSEGDIPFRRWSLILASHNAIAGMCR